MTDTRPTIDAQPALDWLVNQPPLERMAEADAYRTDALALVGAFARIRQGAIVEAHAQGQPLDLSDTSVREAIRPDRELLTEALRLLLDHDATSARRDQVEQGLRPRIAIEIVARRVVFGARHLRGSALDDTQRQLIVDAAARAQEILGDG